MIRKRLRFRCTRAAVLVILPFLLAGCFFNLREKDDFKSWYYGDPGLAGALGEKDCDRYADHIEGQRHPYFLHFRTPEILLQPQGGPDYPERQTAESRAGASKSIGVRCEQVSRGWETFRFDAVDAGWVDTLIPYRKSSAINDGERGMGAKSLAYAEGLLYNTGLSVVMKAPVYIVHDILKTLYIPVARTYYFFKPDEPPEPSTEILPEREASSSADTYPDAGESLEVALAAMVWVDSTPPGADGASPTASHMAPPEARSAGERSAAMAQAEPGDEAPDARRKDEAGHPSSVDREDADGKSHGPAAHARADSSDHAVGEADTGPGQTAGNAPVPSDTGASAAADRAGPFPDESDAAPAPIADPSDEAPAPETNASTPQALVADRQTEGEAAAGKRSENTPQASGEVLTPETPAPAPPGPQAPRPMAGYAARAAAKGDTPGPDNAAAGGAARSGAAALSATAASDDRPPNQGGQRMPAESDPAPLTADRTPSPEPLPPDQASSAAANATPRPAVESPTEPATADTEIPGETERRVREEQGRAAGRNIPAASGGAGDAAEADSSTTLVEEASPTSGPQTEHQAAEDRADAAATLPAVAAGAPDPEEEASAAPTTVEARGEILEEDLLAPGPAGDASPAREVQDPADADEAPSVPASAEPKTASDPMASVTADQHAAPPDEAAPLAPIESVRVAENALQKKVAFIGFFSRAANIDAQTMADLQAYVWPVLESECDKNLVIVRRGDADYPGALDSLVRDPFGRMNSFELVTLSRFSGLNAVVAGTVIDIRIANAISGILWYKSPEGQLRVTILVEVFDAETGTKLLDRTYVREEEVNELEPGADGRLRREDLPILEATLTSMAEEIGDDVCDALEDQPWRAFVSGISGNRITLSAGQGAGLKPGNMLGVYNSQIIDGLNNQQFFLTGERVGRIQLINVHPNRSEAILVEGQGVRDYSVAMPD